MSCLIFLKRGFCLFPIVAMTVATKHVIQLSKSQVAGTNHILWARQGLLPLASLAHPADHGATLELLSPPPGTASFTPARHSSALTKLGWCKAAQWSLQQEEGSCDSIYLFIYLLSMSLSLKPPLQTKTNHSIWLKTLQWLSYHIMHFLL